MKQTVPDTFNPPLYKGGYCPTTVCRVSGGTAASAVPADVNRALDVLDDEVPSTWSGPHVGRRLVDAMRTLRLVPVGIRFGYGSSWPPYVYEWEDLLAQNAQGELERTQQLQNRTRLLPSFAEVSRMERAICWPIDFLSRCAHLVVAVNAVAWAHALERDAGWVAAKRGGYGDTWRTRHDQGCDIIADRLRAGRVPVF